MQRERPDVDREVVGAVGGADLARARVALQRGAAERLDLAPQLGGKAAATGRPSRYTEGSWPGASAWPATSVKRRSESKTMIEASGSSRRPRARRRRLRSVPRQEGRGSGASMCPNRYLPTLCRCWASLARKMTARRAQRCVPTIVVGYDPNPDQHCGACGRDPDGGAAADARRAGARERRASCSRSSST